MEYTLTQLQGMSDGDLRAHWQFSNYPFERGGCDQCLTMHNEENGLCANPDAHRELRQQITAMGFTADEFNAATARENLELIFALRDYFADSYETKEVEELEAATV
jgi:hypothetical protein